MILKKPYAFFIKMFKPIHLVASILIAYLIHLNNKILSFLTNYLHSPNFVVGENIKEELTNNYMYIIPMIVILFSSIVLGIMLKKKKPITFYIINIFAFIIVLVINVYVSNFLSILQEFVVSIKSVKLIHDLTFISIVLEITFFVMFVVRGLGINFKKFDFDSDLSKFVISESDKEEIELDIKFDFNEAKRKKKLFFRNLKYLYIENKFKVNLSILILIFVLGIITFFIIGDSKTRKVEGKIYNVDLVDIAVNSSFILNEDYKGNKISNISDMYLIIVKCQFRSVNEDRYLNLNDFSLKTSGTIFKPTNKYDSKIYDLGQVYKENLLGNYYTNYLIVYEVPERYIDSDMDFVYKGINNTLNIKLNPTKIVSKDITLDRKLGQEISFVDTLGDIKFKINNYEIKDKFLIEYDYCIQENDCLKSKEYLKATINENFDKWVLKLNVQYNNDSDLSVSEFYSFFNKFGSIHYNVDNVWYVQENGFEHIQSIKKSSKDNIYIGVNSNIANAKNIKMVFNIRNSKYEYIIK